MQDRIFDMLMKEDEITWQSILYDLVKSEEMDPWDIDISLLSQKYLETIRKLQEMNFSVSGKVILASAILLKMKSNRLVEEDMVRFESIINPPKEEFIPEMEEYQGFGENKIIVIPKMPQPRRRSVSLQDLVGALQKALQIDQRRLLRRRNLLDFPEVEIPKKYIDINLAIASIYEKIKNFFTFDKKLTFTKLVPSQRKEDKIAAFIPLLHLDHQRKIDLSQKEHFGEIEIKMRDENEEDNISE